MSHRELEIFQALLNAIQLSGRDSASKMYSTEDEGDIRKAGMKLEGMGYKVELNNLPHSGYINVRIQRVAVKADEAFEEALKVGNEKYSGAMEKLADR